MTSFQDRLYVYYNKEKRLRNEKDCVLFGFIFFSYRVERL